LNVHADQDAVYLNYLQKAGILQRAKKGEIEFDLMDAARTRAANGKILEGR
jgi:muramidase (phage lysozyme)